MTEAIKDEAVKAEAVKLSLFGKLSEVMGLVERVPKTGHNKFHGYDYATEADITSAVRAAMASRKLIMVPNVQQSEWSEVVTGAGKKERLCTLTVRFDVHDGESGESLSFVVLGQGQDSGDKATYKAMTGATKYALLKLFLIPTGDDPEAEDGAPAKAAPPPPAGAAALKSKVASPKAAPAAPPSPPPHVDAEFVDAGPRASPPKRRVKDESTGPDTTHDRTATFAFGRDKGVPVGQLDEGSLRFYAGAFKRDLADASKSRWHDKTQAQLALVEAEAAHRGVAL